MEYDDDEIRGERIIGRVIVAFDIASRYDRIHLRNTHYNYAKYLEMAGALEPAIEK
uniref:Reverse transcriptase domain-containing protein n=1 Tax=Heterorhabditis bacteriophora TaxID=37862 RepID=A0A1I7WRH2_HETBA